MEVFSIGLLSLLGGLGLFLYAISRFGDGMQKLAGERIRTVLEEQARQPAASLYTGLGMAAALQNNFLTYGMVSGLVNAGLLGLVPALGIMLGANLGLTITNHLMAINIGVVLFALLFIGYLLYFYIKKLNWHYLGQIVFSLALMYLGFNIIQQAFQKLALEPHALALITALFNNIWLGFLFGLVLAAALRSSNTVVITIQGMVGITLALTAPEFLKGALAIIVGSNVGSALVNTVTGLGRIPTAHKANGLNFCFNLWTAIIWLYLLPQASEIVRLVSQQGSHFYHWFTTVVLQWSTSLTTINQPVLNIWQLAIAHSLFNASVILCWFPITFIAARLGMPFLATHLLPATSTEVSYLDRRALHSPALALILAAREINQMGGLTMEMLKAARLAFLKGQLHLLSNVERDEAIIDDLQEQITFYLSALLSQNVLTEAQSRRLAGLLHIVADIERVGDHANSIARLADKKHQEQLPFSDLALNEIELFFSKAVDLYQKAHQSLIADQLDLAKQVVTRAHNIDKLEDELRQNHIYRLNQGKCWPGAGVVYIELLSNLQRVSAHAASIAATVLEEEGEA